jgi:Tfp pilus assembly protein PilX
VSTLERSQKGSIAIAVMVMMVATTLVIAVLASAESGLKLSRRGGDSANALQLADAGINDALRQIATTSGNTLSPATVSLGSAGSYTFSASRDAYATVWHLDSVGTDATGVKRHVKADGTTQKLFGNALFTQSTLRLASGSSADSFADGTTAAQMCTQHGIVGTNDPNHFTFNSNGQGQAISNCRGNTYGYATDGCVSYGDGTQALPPYGSGACPPPPATSRASPALQLPTVQAPAVTQDQNPNNASNPNVCDSTHAIRGGQIYYWKNVVLRAGCTVDTTGGRAIIYTPGQVEVGDPKGNSGQINAPPTNTAICGNTATSTLKDAWNNPAAYYCPGWSANLQIYIISGSGSPGMLFHNHAQFWGVIEAPTTAVLTDGNGSPHVDVFGSIVANTASPNAQFAFHYDDSLGDLAGTGRYEVANWREEAVT